MQPITHNSLDSTLATYDGDPLKQRAYDTLVNFYTATDNPQGMKKIDKIMADYDGREMVIINKIEKSLADARMKPSLRPAESASPSEIGRAYQYQIERPPMPKQSSPPKRNPPGHGVQLDGGNSAYHSPLPLRRGAGRGNLEQQIDQGADAVGYMQEPLKPQPGPAACTTNPRHDHAAAVEKKLVMYDHLVGQGVLDPMQVAKTMSDT